jgi:hypothetical protein
MCCTPECRIWLYFIFYRTWLNYSAYVISQPWESPLLNGYGKAHTTRSNAKDDVYKVRTDLGAKTTSAVAPTGSSCVGVIVPTIMTRFSVATVSTLNAAANTVTIPLVAASTGVFSVTRKSITFRKSVLLYFGTRYFSFFNLTIDRNLFRALSEQDSYLVNVWLYCTSKQKDTFTP